MSIYLDYNATTPVDPQVLEKMLPFFSETFGNAASKTHPAGWLAEKAVDDARERMATHMGFSAQELVFTSGATEAINLAIKGVAEAYQNKGKHIITLQTEHKATLDVCKSLERKGYSLTYLPVDKEGVLDLTSLKEALTEETILVAVMLANNETGVIQDLPAISQLVHEASAIMLSDAVQAVGKIPVKVDKLGIDLMPLSAHKFYGPKGVGALYVRRRNPRVKLFPLIEGGGHERGRRSGTLNVPGIVGMDAALDLSVQLMESEEGRLKILRDQFEGNLLELKGTHLNGRADKRLTHVSNLSFEGVESESLIMAMRELSVATGSACTSANMEPSHVLKAMGVHDELAYAAIRFSMGRFTTEEDIQTAIEVVKRAVSRLRLEKTLST
ncbi:MAG: aminotransferase class V-fold PLP-dependent enzyme [Bacteroidota bacterium]